MELTQTQITIEKPRILIVDDSRVMRKSMRRLLSHDFDVVEADDGDVAWDMIQKDNGIQVVFSDLMMPRVNGFQLLRNIRESIHNRISHLPVIIITGHNDDEKMHRQAMSLGATDFITKPFDSLHLKARARSAVKFQDTNRKLAQAQHTLEKQSTIDPLTGLPNLRYFTQHGPEMLSFAIRHGSPISIIRFNVDKYDVLYQKKGKELAERVLINISKIISGTVREEDTAARVGLAKFAVLMPGADEDSAVNVAARVHQIMLKTGYRVGNTRFRMTISAGLVTPQLTHDLQFDEVLKIAEARLAKAIATGGNRVITNAEQETPQTETKPAVAPEPQNLLSVEEALVLLKAGETRKVDEQVRSLMLRTYPLLVFANKKLGLGLESNLLQIKEKLQRH
ncbi:MAG: response regulator [Gammaproteobacteria bacterium]|jgi:two-component system cell cycle response regulator